MGANHDDQKNNTKQVDEDRYQQAENPSGVDARFSYANERTLLAWVRTALGLITAGLAIAELLPPFRIAAGRRIIGIPLIALGVVVAFLSIANWKANERAMHEGREPPKSPLPLLVAGVVGAVALTALIIAIVAH